MTHTYPDPVAKLLTYGKTNKQTDYKRWPDYSKLGLTRDHIPELIRLATDDTINDIGGTKAWALLHALRALGQLNAPQALKPLIEFLDTREVVYPLDDILLSELETVCSLIGKQAIPVLKTFMGHQNFDLRITISSCLRQVAEDHSDCRQECINALHQQLELYEHNDSTFNGCLIADLAALKAVDCIDVIRAAVAANCVDMPVIGTLEDVEIYMGLREACSTPLPLRYKSVPSPFAPSQRADKKRVRARNSLPRISKNGPCPCGSGKKYKRCCMLNNVSH